MKVATWNVNSVRAREARLLAFLSRHRPDILCLQELKGEADVFPSEVVRDLGYEAAVFGQKAYNGVAILSRIEPRDVSCGLDDGVDDPEARLVSATVNGVRVLSVYVPNGGEVGTPKWTYKLTWLARLARYLERTCQPSEPIVVCGDFNVAPDDRDVANPETWQDSVLCHSEGRARLRGLLSWGLVDVVRRQYPAGGVYTWWDYRHLGFPKNNGLRIDLVLATASLMCTDATIDRDERKGERPSDHAPVIVNLEKV